MSESGEVLGEWVVDLRTGLERELARWLDLVSTWLQNAAPEPQRCISDGWAVRP